MQLIGHFGEKVGVLTILLRLLPRSFLWNIPRSHSIWVDSFQSSSKGQQVKNFNVNTENSKKIRLLITKINVFCVTKRYNLPAEIFKSLNFGKKMRIFWRWCFKRSMWQGKLACFRKTSWNITKLEQKTEKSLIVITKIN